MYRKIFIPIDNSQYSNYCIDIGVSIAEKLGSQLIGSHVYSAALHDRRFKDMEGGLPEHYQQEERLKKSRMVHNSLIEDGLRLISDAYMDVFEKKCVEAKISFNRKLMEGKNWFELTKDIQNNKYDLVIIGILGLGAVNPIRKLAPFRDKSLTGLERGFPSNGVNGNLIGSVCERVVRRVRTDVLVIKNSRHISERIVVAIDGSNHSFLAFDRALILGKIFNLEIEAISVYDPHFHRKAFKGLVGVLSEEAGKKFKFKEQEKLHDHVIDDGLKKIYQGYLNKAAERGNKQGFEVKTTLLAGKPYHEIYGYLESDPLSLLVISRYGAHQVEEPEIGNTAENLLRLSTCNVLMTYSSF
jgi:nucleotide-binding universal stress UspA family protein